MSCLGSRSSWSGADEINFQSSSWFSLDYYSLLKQQGLKGYYLYGNILYVVYGTFPSIWKMKFIFVLTVLPIFLAWNPFKCFFPIHSLKLSLVGSLRNWEVVCSASDLRGLNFESWRAVSSHSSHHPQEVLLAQFRLYVHKSGLKPDSFLTWCTFNINSSLS